MYIIMYPNRPRPDRVKIKALHEHAAENLIFIRETMERAGYFTAVSGWGTAIIGFTAILATFIASQQSSTDAWLVTWLVDAALAIAIGVGLTCRKAYKAKIPILSGIGRKFAFSLCPPMLAGAFLTAVFYRVGLISALPGLWLLLYGTGIVTGGAFSARVVRVMGLCFMLLGVAASFSPPSWGDGFMGTGFGGLHIIFGWWMARKDNG